jgi:hypothetical protein
MTQSQTLPHPGSAHASATARVARSMRIGVQLEQDRRLQGPRGEM